MVWHNDAIDLKLCMDMFWASISQVVEFQINWISERGFGPNPKP